MLKPCDADNHDFPVRLYVSDIPKEASFFDEWYEKMPTVRRERCDRFRMEADRKRCIAAYALLVYALCDMNVQDTDTVDMKEGPDGKPYIADAPVFFNISHAKDRVTVAISPMDVGCDVEYRSANALKVAKRFFASEEYEYLNSLSDEETRNNEFTKLWTLKESVVKCLGEGIRRAFNDFRVADETGKREYSVRIEGDGRTFYIKEFESEGGYCYSICSVYDKAEDKMRFIDLAQSGVRNGRQ